MSDPFALLLEMFAPPAPQPTTLQEYMEVGFCRAFQDSYPVDEIVLEVRQALAIARSEHPSFTNCEPELLFIARHWFAPIGPVTEPQTFVAALYAVLCARSELTGHLRAVGLQRTELLKLPLCVATVQ